QSARPSLGSAATARSGTDRIAEPLRPFWYAGRAKCRLTPKPPWPVGGIFPEPFHQASPPYVYPLPPGSGVVPPTAVAWGELAGTPTVFGLPSRHRLPVAPLPVHPL